MFEGRKLRKCGDGSTLSFTGIETGRMSLHQLKGDVLVVKVEGGTYWSGLGLNRGYAPTEFIVFKVDVHEDGKCFTVKEVIVAFPVRKINKQETSI
jgi:hypothetical protein